MGITNKSLAEIKSTAIRFLYYLFLLLVPTIIIVMLMAQFFLAPNIQKHILSKIYLHVYQHTEINLFKNVHFVKQKIHIHSKNEIKQNISTMLIYFNRYMSDENITLLAETLSIGEKKYSISHYDVLAIIGVESRFKINAINFNTNQSTDYGLTQQNSNYIIPRFYKASQILNAYKIPCNINNYNDIALNVLSCILFLDTLRNATAKNAVINDIRFFEKFHQIGAYNTGIAGLHTKRKKAQTYFKRFTYYKTIITLMS